MSGRELFAMGAFLAFFQGFVLAPIWVSELPSYGRAAEDARTLLHMHGDNCEREAMARADAAGYASERNHWRRVAGKCPDVREGRE